jgi:hypothetical protein
LQVELDVLLNAARSEGRKAADTALSERVAELERGLEAHFRPNDTVYGQPALLNPSEGEAGT